MLLQGGGAATTSKPVTLPKGRYQGLSQQGVFLAPWAMKKKIWEDTLPFGQNFLKILITSRYRKKSKKINCLFTVTARKK